MLFYAFARPLVLSSLLWAVVGARPFTVVAYNVENLFDVDGVAAYEDYQPAVYTRFHALTKLQNIARVVGRFEAGRGPDVLMLAELELDATPGKNPPNYAALLAQYAGVPLANLLVEKFTPEIADLPAEFLLLKALNDAGMTGYHVVIGDNITTLGSDRKQEITCGVFTRFPVKRAISHPTLNARAILEVQVEVDGALLYLFANHWKSGAGDPEIEPTRVANAQTLRTRLDQILQGDPHADIIIGGDLNSQYNQKKRYPKMKTTGINDTLRSQGDELAVRGVDRDLYNLWFELPPRERGSDTYRGEWGTLMHIIVARGLYDYRGVQYVDNSFAIGKFAGLNMDERGLPVRWSGFGPRGGGFSDHFPVSAKFITVSAGRADRWLELSRASVESGDTGEPVKIGYAGMDLVKSAVTAESLAAGTVLRSPLFLGKIVRVEGVVAAGARLAVEFMGETYDIYSHDEHLRKKLREDFKPGDRVRFYGELGLYRDRWQWVIQDATWIK